jgi:hypothetical protein
MTAFEDGVRLGWAAGLEVITSTNTGKPGAYYENVYVILHWGPK